MTYHQLPPPPYLQSYIRYFWTLESSDNSLAPKTLGPLADGCPGLFFQPSEKGVFFDQYHKKLPQVFIYGQTVKRTAIYLIGNFETLGISFFPNALKSIFGFNAREHTDACLDLNLLSATRSINLSEQLLNAPSAIDQMKALSAWLFSLVNKNKATADPVTNYALSQIIQSNGKVALRELQKNLRLSERSFERRFEQQVGISPKMYSRVCRFQASLNQLKGNNYTKLSDIAFDNGYTDQSHFIRTFKEFAGCSPSEFQKQSYEVVGDFPVLVA